MKSIFIFTLVTIIFWGCSKDASTKNDRDEPVIIISSPVTGTVFNGGETITISGNMTDNNRISEVHFHIYNKTTGALLIDIHRLPETSTYSFTEVFAAQAGMQYRIQVLAKDQAANEAVSTIEVSAN